ncbi:hypothetical protein MBEHAL_0493 [Halarchaeum acidiphilum MH1-52-1]|uniref:Uncharacterized protein n=1 Tax=Halarchaeum acidiphilum MH1-52-1 TaxID=1261545 RepID=U3AAD9_9EURY|nr:hypothetical protein MBEHAL_0493 [Halarchaeum acidiphilum MH1-52-1]
MHTGMPDGLLNFSGPETVVFARLGAPPRYRAGATSTRPTRPREVDT